MIIFPHPFHPNHNSNAGIDATPCPSLRSAEVTSEQIAVVQKVMSMQKRAASIRFMNTKLAQEEVDDDLDFHTTLQMAAGVDVRQHQIHFQPASSRTLHLCQIIMASLLQVVTMFLSMVTTSVILVYLDIMAYLDLERSVN